MNNQIKAPGFVSFITSPAGRWTRAIIGLAMIGGGLAAATTAGYVVAVIGLVPFCAGAFDVCVLGPLFGGSFRGDLMRQELHRQVGHPEWGARSHSWVKA